MKQYQIKLISEKLNWVCCSKTFMSAMGCWNGMSNQGRIQIQSGATPTHNVVNFLKQMHEIKETFGLCGGDDEDAALP